MLTITILGDELFNEETQEFTTTNDTTFNLEHSLSSLSKWEAEYGKPFLGDGEKTNSEILDYIFFMIETPGIDRAILDRLSHDNLSEINDYINSRRTATTFREFSGPKSREVITSELIYYWMVSFRIPFECDKWNLNRLFALIKVCNIKNSKQKRMPSGQIARQNREINERRLAKYKTSG